ncbi:SGNH/GDSL hydrolase family protein [Ferruginibacter paludis]|uniref:SGNH/GDSL hydrolase family protein n=1 Tax=Ferruginibacter paludis TaxID=1310417 RepID=UPI0025B28CE5|nr:SGNH/GDSL hydrolase family protein [Ferruginibacter paludis]MDN3659140.1 SGNH/GDSL hydrolase family protein [Ferruginibacter paludis]
MNRKLFLPLILGLMLCLSHGVIAQKKVVIMGSSTAAGYGATSYALSWGGLLESSFNVNTSDGTDTLFYNIAIGGYTTYEEMYTGCYVPPGRPAPDPMHNVTMALSYTPDVVIINLPSNDEGAGFSINETMYNLRQMYSTITASGAKCYITTAQPRNDYAVSQRQDLYDMKDSILAQFGTFAVNFWDDLVTSDGLNMLRPDRKDPYTDMHPNDLGHQFLFERVQAKNIFGFVVLPLQITRFNGQLKNTGTELNWHIEQQELNTVFEIERSATGLDFEPIFSLTSVTPNTSGDFAATDRNPLPGHSYYRLKVTEPARSLYSSIISINNNNNVLKIARLFTSNSASTVTADISSTKNELAIITLVNSAGVVLKQIKQYLTAPSTRISLAVSHLAEGKYYLKVTTAGNAQATRAFIK